MHLKLKHITLLLSLLALSACTERPAVEDPSTSANGKTPIELSVGGVDSPSPTITRAVITDGTDKTMQAFDVNSKIFMIIKSEYSALASPYDYMNYGGSQTTKYTVTRGEVAASSNDVTFNTDEQKRYWDDAHARSSNLSIWAYAQKGESTWNNCTFEEPNTGSYSNPLEAYKDYPCNTTTLPSPVWRETEIYPAIRYWRASHHPSDDIQDERSVRCQDLLFSNNIVNYYGNTKVPDASRTDNRLTFDPATKHFPSKTDEWSTGVKKTEMKFYHAMSKITIHIKRGSGFETGNFAFTPSTSNVALSGFNKKGLFHIGDGQFQYIWKHKPNSIIDDTDVNAFYIPQIYNWQTPADGDAMTLEALVVPNIHEFLQSQTTATEDTHSRFVSESTDVMMEFTVNNNKYQITSGQLYTALHGQSGATEKTDNGTYIPMEAGKNYDFTFTIGKQLINNISAKLAAWDNVIATGQDPSNAYVRVSVKTNEGSAIQGNPNFDLYRAPGTTYEGTDYNTYADYTWEKGYEKSTSLAETTSNSGVYQTEWYWPDNKTFYHLRTISPTSESISGNDATTYVSMTGGLLSTAKDYVWGAPFKTDSPTPDNYSFTTGYCNNANKADGQLYKAIGATTDNITLIQHHMTTQVFVDLENDNTVAEANRVNITGATVQLINIAQNAKLYLGNGLVTEYSNFGDVTMTADAHAAASPIPAYDYSYGVLPQLLSNNNGTKKVGIKITTTDGNVYIIDDIKTIKIGGNAITKWLPGRKYYYTFTLKKTGITNISATIVNWETVTADNEDVTIK